MKTAHKLALRFKQYSKGMEARFERAFKYRPETFEALRLLLESGTSPLETGAPLQQIEERILRFGFRNTLTRAQQDNLVRNNVDESHRARRVSFLTERGLAYFLVHARNLQGMDDRLVAAAGSGGLSGFLDDENAFQPHEFPDKNQCKVHSIPKSLVNCTSLMSLVAACVQNGVLFAKPATLVEFGKSDDTVKLHLSTRIDAGALDKHFPKNRKA